MSEPQPNPAQKAITGQGWTFKVPVPPKITVSRQQVAFGAGLAVLAVAGIIEAPLAAVLFAGHALITQHHSDTLEAFGEALNEPVAE